MGARTEMSLEDQNQEWLDDDDDGGGSFVEPTVG